MNDKNSTYRYYDETYLEQNKNWHLEDSQWKANQVLKIIKKNELVASSICEVGCGAGGILAHLSNMSPLKSVNFFGYEISPIAYRLCSSKSSKRLKFYLKDILIEKVSYDLLLCIDVFEHVENHMEFLKEVKPKAKYKIFHIPLDLSVSSVLRGSFLEARKTVGHLHYFTPDLALETLNDCGYEVVDSFLTPAFSAVPPKTFKERLTKIPRSLLFKLSPKLMSKLIGGASLLVLTK